MNVVQSRRSYGLVDDSFKSGVSFSSFPVPSFSVLTLLALSVLALHASSLPAVVSHSRFLDNVYLSLTLLPVVTKCPI